MYAKAYAYALGIGIGTDIGYVETIGDIYTYIYIYMSFLSEMD